MKHFVIILFLFLSNYLFSQDNQEVKDSISDIIKNKRDSLIIMSHISHRSDFLKIFEVLKKIEEKNYKALLPIERWLIDYYIEDYKDIIQTIIKYDTSFYSSSKYNSTPLNDSLGYFFYNYSRAFSADLLAKINSSSNSQYEKDILKLIFRTSIFDFKIPVIYQDTLNSYSNTFIQEYPESEYIPFVRDHIYIEIVPSNFSSNIYFSLGVGDYSKSLANSFGQNGFGIIGFDLGYKKVCFNISLSGGSSIVDKEFEVNNIIWPKNTHPVVLLFEVSCGYNVLDLRHFRLIPFSGLSALLLKPIDKDIQTYSTLKNSHLEIPMFTLGLVCDFKYKLHLFDKYYGSHNNNLGLVRLRFGSNFPLNSYNGNIGSMNYLTIGWGCTFRKITSKKTK